MQPQLKLQCCVESPLVQEEQCPMSTSAGRWAGTETHVIYIEDWGVCLLMGISHTPPNDPGRLTPQLSELGKVPSSSDRSASDTAKDPLIGSRRRRRSVLC